MTINIIIYSFLLVYKDKTARVIMLTPNKEYIHFSDNFITALYIFTLNLFHMWFFFFFSCQLLRVPEISFHVNDEKILNNRDVNNTMFLI